MILKNLSLGMMPLKSIVKAGIMFLGVFGTHVAKTQESVNASGGLANGSGGTASYSIGQVGYKSYTNGTLLEEQGVQHAYELVIVGGNPSFFKGSLIVFPNPTTHNLTLQLSEDPQETLFYQLIDAHSKILEKKAVLSSQTTIDMVHFANATYFLHVVNDKQEPIQVLKIIKH